MKDEKIKDLNKDYALAVMNKNAIARGLVGQAMPAFQADPNGNCLERRFYAALQRKKQRSPS